MLRLKQDLERPILLLLEDLIRVGRFLERQVMSCVVVHAERIVIAADQREQIIICLSNIWISGIGLAAPP
jgi:hypothetical protein